MPEGFEDTSQGSESIAAEAPIQDNSTEVQAPAAVEQANPFWGEVEQKLGPNNYKLIQPYLTKADTDARERITKVNESFAPWKQFADQGYTPEHVNQAFGIVQQLNDPQGQIEIYQSLKTFLEENGRMPSAPELAQQVAEDQVEEVDPRDQELQALKEQQLAVFQYLQAQEDAQRQAQVDAAADQWIGSELQRIQQANPGFNDADMKQVVRFALFQAQQTGQDPNLDAAAAAFSAERDRIRTTPRPTDTAPRIPGAAGGTPSATDQGHAMSREDRLAAVTARLAQGQQ